MLNNISWANYAIAIGISLVLYYVLVLVIYYRNELAAHFGKLKKTGEVGSLLNDNSAAGFETTGIIENASKEMVPADPFPHHHLELENIIKTGAYKGSPKEEVFAALKFYLRNEALQEGNPEKKAINKFIIEHFENYYSVHLSDDEAVVLWIK